MKTKNFLILIMILLAQDVLGQQEYTVSGLIKDTSTDVGLPGANILLEGKPEGAMSNEEGRFVLSLSEGEHVLRVSHVGYEPRLLNLDLTEDVTQEINLVAKEERLEEVIIQSRDGVSLSEPEMSVSRLSRKAIKEMPVVLGEVDVLKSITQLPGVTTSGEGSAGFQVRGGSADQNMVLLDGAPVFSTSHFFGFFSIFNNDAIHNAKLYKGAIPAEYGGRLASVLDITQKSGSFQEFKGNGGIGSISSRFLAEGPLNENRTSFLLGGRTSYAHLFLKAADHENSAYFYDLNAKLDHKLNGKSSLHFTGYLGRDFFSLNNDFKNSYGNRIMSLKWDQVFSDRLSSSLTLSYSNYEFNLDIEASEFESLTGIQNLNLTYDLDHYISAALDLKYGFNFSAYRFNPGEIVPRGEESGLNYLKLEDKDALEGAAHLQANHQVSPRIKLSYGMRYSRFDRLGETTQNIYSDKKPVYFNEDLGIYEKSKPIGTVSYGSGEKIISYNNWEPRVSVAYSWDQHAIKLGYNRMSQYLHLLSNTLSPTPMDLWVPSDTHIRPQLLDQIAAGYHREYGEGDYTLELELFAKKVKNRLNYIDGADLIGNPAIEQVLLNGKGRAYGLELLMRKTTGRLTWWLAYTLSKGEQKTPGRTALEPGINFGNWYNANHDRTHDLSFNANYNLSDKWSFATNFSFQSGRATTYPDGYYKYLDVHVPKFGSRNSGRLPAYHRLDLAATYTPKPNRKRGWKSEWNFGIYNVYNRRNANSISFSQNRETGTNEAVQLSIFGIIPSITYNFKF